MGVGGGGGGHPDPEIRGGGGPPGPLPWIRHCWTEMFVISGAHGTRVSFCLPERGEEKDAPCMPKSGQAFEVPDVQNFGIVNLVLYYQTSFPGLLNVSGKLPTFPSPKPIFFLK